MSLFAAVATQDTGDPWMSTKLSLLVLIFVGAGIAVGLVLLRDDQQCIQQAAQRPLAQARLEAAEQTPVPLIPVPPVAEKPVVQSVYPARHRAEGEPDDPTRVLAVCPQLRAEAERLVASGVARKPVHAPHLQTRADGSVRA